MKKYLDFEEARRISLEMARINTFKEIISLENSLGRVISQDIICQKNLPSFNNSAMDGFAIKFCEAANTLLIKETIFAGQTSKKKLKENECYKIMTGAKVPNDADTIVPIEDVLVLGNSIKIKKEIKKGSCLRLKGEEQKVGNILYKKGESITASMVAVLASQGMTMIKVTKALSIAIVSTGDEIKEPWEHASEDEIYNCNSFALLCQLKEKGFSATYTGVIPDNLEESEEFIKNLKSYDVIITSGGISMGDADFVGQAFLNNGLEIFFHGVNVKPGRPIMMGKLNATYVMCLPGNPLTAMVNLHLFVLPVLYKLQGNNNIYHDYESAVNQEAFNVKKGRVNLVLGWLEKSEFTVSQKNKYGSGMISVLGESNAILVSNTSSEHFLANNSVKVIRFSCSFLNEQINIFN
ncbi:MAG: molybdopterin molybdenumtransferase MoeA [Arcobacter sp.]|nr:MAG: molybdopterin molybdenumtransferase MoeA [Arcobacter sp.]